MRVPRRRRSSGFSLIELMISMVVTLVVSGAIYGLMAGGQTAFVREPVLVERQQNIRIAMDMIVRDAENAGATMMPPQDGTRGPQVFTAADPDGTPLDNWTAAGSPLSPLTTAQRTYLGLGGSAGSDRADSLEMLTSDGGCPSLKIKDTPAPGTSLTIEGGLPRCVNPTPTRGQLVYAAGIAGPANKAVGAAQPGILYVFGPTPNPAAVLNATPGSGGGNSALNPGASDACLPATTCQWLSTVQIVRYQIAPEDPAAAEDPLKNPYSLWRSDTGLWKDDGSALTDPPGSGSNNPWRLVARGIDDLQVQYQSGAEWPANPNTWRNTPPPVTTQFSTAVQRVRITLSGYAVGRNVGGETQGGVSGAAGRARRGQLTTIVTPRSALLAVSVATTNPWR